MQIYIARNIASIACVELDLVLRNSKKIKKKKKKKNFSKFFKWKLCELNADLYYIKHSFDCLRGNEGVLRKVQEKDFLRFFENSRL